MPDIIKWEAKKDVDEVLDWTHSWEPRLLVNGVNVGDHVREPDDADITKRPVIEVNPPAEGFVNDVQLIAALTADDKTQLWFEGGSVGKHKITASVWTVQGRRYQQVFVLTINDN
jgi:hypothetical protein